MSDLACSDACLSVGFLFVTVHPKKVRRSDEGSSTLRVPPGKKTTRSTLLSQFCLPGSVFSRTDLTYFQSCVPHVFERERDKEEERCDESERIVAVSQWEF
ncbi:unnamed protein product [Leuciscus chuanchicus]